MALRRRAGWSAALIIHRYLLRELVKPLLSILAILVALFASYSTASFLSDAVNGLLPGGAVAKLTFLKVVISLEVLIPAALYVSVILTFARLHSDSEFAAMFALRLTPAVMFRAVLTLSTVLALVVGCLSIYVRPWAYRNLHEMADRAATLLDVDAMQAGSFYVSQHGARVVFLTHRNGPGTPARDVFVKLAYSDHDEIISGRLASAVPSGIANGGSDVNLTDANLYELNHAPGKADEILHVQAMTVDPNSRGATPGGYSSVAASTARIARSDSSEDIAELQWRLSTPLSTILLGLLGIPLSRTRPRQSRNLIFGKAFAVYFGYYLLCTCARTWVQHGTIAEFPGIWWAPGILGLLLTTMAGRRPAVALGK